MRVRPACAKRPLAASRFSNCVASGHTRLCGRSRDGHLAFLATIFVVDHNSSARPGRRRSIGKTHYMHSPLPSGNGEGSSSTRPTDLAYGEAAASDDKRGLLRRNPVRAAPAAQVYPIALLVHRLPAAHSDEVLHQNRSSVLSVFFFGPSPFLEPENALPFLGEPWTLSAA